jgi:hypothetical protein
MSRISLVAAILLGYALIAAAGCAGGGNPAKSAVERNDMTMFRALLDGGQVDFEKPVWAFNLNLMEYAACKGRKEAIREMLKRGVDINKGHEVSKKFGVRYTPLIRAMGCIGSGGADMVRFMLDNGARVDALTLDVVQVNNLKDGPVGEMVREAYELQAAGKSAAKPVAAQASPRQEYGSLDAAVAAALAARQTQPRAGPGNTDDAAYDRMRAAAGMAPEKRGPVSDVDSPSQRGAPRPDDFALVIGVEGYQSLPKADHGERDAQTVRKHLEALGFPARNIVSLEGSGATKSKLESYLKEWLPLNVKPSSTLFVYYSGHGAPDPKSGDAYLVPWDGDPKFLKSTAYPLAQLYADLSKTKAKRVIVALDACFSGAGGRSVLAQGARPLVAKVADVAAAPRVTVLAAASGDEITGTLEEQGHGLFTYHLLKGLAADPKASAKSLHAYLLPKVQDDARRQNREQTPTLSGASLDAPLLP